MVKRYEKPLSLEELAALPDEQIDTSDIPPLDKAFFRNARLIESAKQALAIAEGRMEPPAIFIPKST